MRISFPPPALPAAHPSKWRLEKRDGRLAWAFLLGPGGDDAWRGAAWFVISESRPGASLSYSLQVPRLTPALRPRSALDAELMLQRQFNVRAAAVCGMPPRDDPVLVDRVARDLVRSRGTRLGRPPSVHPHIAWRRDIEGESTYRIAAEDGLHGTDPRRTVASQLRRTQSAYALAGALPWAAWRDGDLPMDWWRTSTFLDAVSAWVTDGHLMRLWEEHNRRCEHQASLLHAAASAGFLAAMREQDPRAMAERVVAAGIAAIPDGERATCEPLIGAIRRTAPRAAALARDVACRP